MRKVWKILFNALVVSMTIIPANGFSQSLNTGIGVDGNRRIDELDQLSFIEMLNSVEPDEKTAPLVRRFQEAEGRNKLYRNQNYSKNGVTVETYRNKEVLLLTIPASKLFAPNDVELKKEAKELLAPLRRYLKEPDMYRVLLVMHTDNTGSESYREAITEDRVMAVFDWFEEAGTDTRYLFSYALSDDMPLYPNDSMDNRAQNRRLEIYLMPGKAMLSQAKKGKIEF